MFRSLKQIKIYALMLICALTFFALFGCAPQSSTSEDEEEPGIVRKYVEAEALESQKEGAYKITYPVTPETIMKHNGITITRVNEDLAALTNADTENTKQKTADTDANTETQKLNISESSVSYLVIDGLLNKEVEQKINDTIHQTALDLYNAKLPPYRAIRTEDFSQYTFSKNVYAYECANFSNILSVVVSVDISGWANTSETDHSNSICITEMIPLNFYLKTGEQFPLGDLFADNYDYKEVVNSKISDYLMKYNLSAGDKVAGPDFFDSFTTVSLVSPFKGISDNQKFSINNNSISLVFDYSTPEFSTGYSNEYLKGYQPGTITLNYSDPQISEILGVFKRFETEENLYENERTKSFISSNYPEKSVSVMYGTPEDYGLATVTEGYTDISFFTSIPLAINNKELSTVMNAKYDAARENLVSLAKSTLAKYAGNQVSLSSSYNVKRLGKYLTEEETKTAYVYANEGGSLYELNESNYAIYNEKTGKKVTLAELFKEGSDYRTIILDAIKASRAAWQDPADTLYDGTLLKVIDNGDFMLYQDSLQITYTYPDGTQEFCNIPFEYLSQDSLAIFD